MVCLHFLSDLMLLPNRRPFGFGFAAAFHHGAQNGRRNDTIVLIMESENLHATVAKLRDRQAELAARPSDLKKKHQSKKQKTRDEAGSKLSPASRKRDESKVERETTKAKLLATRKQRGAAGFAPKSRKYTDHLNKRLKDVISCLLDKRHDMTKAEICAYLEAKRKEKNKTDMGNEKHIDEADTELWSAVSNNTKIEVVSGGWRFRYRPQHHHITDKEKLLMHVRRQTQGTPWKDISDTYKEVEADLEALVKDKKIFVIENPDMEDRVIFWNDPTQGLFKEWGGKHECVCSVEGVDLSEQMLELWRLTQPPSENRIYEELIKKSGIVPAPRKEVRKREPVQKVPRERKPRDFKHRKITNVHLPELLAAHQPEQID